MDLARDLGGEAAGLRLHNSLSNAQEPILGIPGPDGSRLVRLYVCGVTPYDTGHMGHAFTFCSYDVLVRWLEASGLGVRYVQNVTDVDDPLFERARRDGVPWQELAERETGHLIRDMTLLGWRAPDHMPRVSEEIEPILEALQQLWERGCAYQTDRVYFPVAAYPSYGALSQLSRRSMIRKLKAEGLLGEVGAGGKRDALDFPLWRPSQEGEPSWPSSFGPGRPGWHIECSVMAMRYLGDQIEIHGGGRDLKFSHHESERAQSEVLTGRSPFAGCWTHVGMVRYQGHKMSKSLGNLVVVEEAAARVPAAAIRLYLAMHHYRRDWSFEWAGLERAALLCSDLARLIGDEVAPETALSAPPGARVAQFGDALNRDLDTARAVTILRRTVVERDAAAARWMTSILCGRAALR